MLKWWGWAYIGYHIPVGGTLLVALAYTWPVLPRQFNGLSDVIFAVLLYPILLPAFAVCGGLHGHCESILGHVTRATVFTLMAILAGLGIGTVVLAALTLLGPKRK